MFLFKTGFFRFFLFFIALLTDNLLSDYLRHFSTLFYRQGWQLWQQLPTADGLFVFSYTWVENLIVCKN